MTHRVRSYGLLVASAAALLVSRSARAEFPQILLNTDATTQLQNEQQVTINPLDPDNAVACWRDFRLGYRQVGVGYTFDGGQTWTDFLIGGELPWDSDPVITVDDDGTFYMVVINYQDGGANQLSVHRSNTGGVSWDGPFTAVFSPGTTFEDKEWIAVDRTGGPRNGNVYIAWARFYDVQIHCVTSTDRGATWSPPTPVSSASSSGQWPVPVVLQNGNLLVAWDRYDDDVIAYDVSTNGGATWGTDRILSSCTTGVQSTINGGIGVFPFPALCVDESDGFRAGWVYCLYADEPVASNGMDIWIRHSSDNGNTWSERVRVNDDPLGQNRDQFHPWISCDEQGVLYAMWYDRRDDASNLDWHIYASRSQDGGLTWETNERITDVPSSPSDAAARDVAERGPDTSALQPAAVRAGLIGEYSGIAALQGKVYTVWTDTRRGNQDTYASYFPAVTGVQGAEAALRTFSLRAYPNPAAGQSRIELRAPGVSTGVEVAIYDMSGREVRRLSDGTVEGETSVDWDGVSEDGHRLPAGVYFAQVLGIDGLQGVRTKVVLL